MITVSILSLNINHYNYLIKNTWCESPIILIILFALSLTMLTIGIFINYKNNIVTLPLFFMIIFFELILFFTFYSRNYSLSILISSFIFILTSFEIVAMIDHSIKDIYWLCSPFLIFSLIQLAIIDDIAKYNIDYYDTNLF